MLRTTRSDRDAIISTKNSQKVDHITAQNKEQTKQMKMASATLYASKSKAEKTQQSTAQPLSPAAESAINALSAAGLLSCCRCELA